ncbi:MAG: hypothetical protein ACLUPK_02555 [Veillonella sp.]
MKLTKALVLPDFDGFNRKWNHYLMYAVMTMTKYCEDGLPVFILLCERTILSRNTKAMLALGTRLSIQLRIAETSNARVTYFFNGGNREEPFEGAGPRSREISTGGNLPVYNLR